jgi:V/A-type H+-transporting ATPase subunit F
MISVAVIGDSDTAMGFRLAGVKDVYEYRYDGDGNRAVTNDGEDAARILDELVKENIAIIIVNERFAAKNKEKIREINSKKKGVTPIIVEVPDKKGPIEKEIDEIGRLIKRAVGIVIK